VRVSVLCPTMRVGGIDVLLHGLSKQTHRDFELVLSDALWGYRHDLVQQEAERFGVHVVHVEPRGLRFPVCTYCRHMNEAIVHATGDLALLIVDYTWLAPDTLARHVAHHNGKPRAGLMGPHRYAALPAIKPIVSHYGHSPSETERYANDVRSRALDSMMLSIFLSFEGDPRLFPDADDITDGVRHRDPKFSEPAGPIHPFMLHCRNESVRLEHLIEINGFDEDLDGTHGWQDSDIADRLTIKVGVEWQHDPSLVTHIVNPRPVFPFGLRERPNHTNEAIWRRKQAMGYPAVNSWNLREARKATT
jgi:hypothetical protein